MNSDTPSQASPQSLSLSPTKPAENSGDLLNLQSSRGRGSSRPAPTKPWTTQRTAGTIVAIALIGLAFLGGVFWLTGSLFGKKPFTGNTWTVRREPLKVTIVERGSLESAKNGDIICNVRSGTKG